MTLIYNCIILFLDVLIRIASIFHPKAKLFTAGRKDVISELKKKFENNQSPVVWIHCASLGEFEQGRPVIEAIKAEFKTHKILLTFFSPSGYEVRKNYNQADFISYLPWDTKKNAKKLIEIAKPSLAIFVKYEFWLHYSDVLKKNKIPLISISAIFRRDQVFFKSYAGFYRKVLHNFSYFFVQNHDSCQLLNSIGLKNCLVAGDTRFDRVSKILQQSEPISVAERFKSNQKLMVIGSCWPEDLDALLPFINENRLKFIIAPHEISENFMKTLENALQVKAIRYSQVNSQPVDDFTVLIIDNIGMLSRLYRYGEFAYIGGAFGKGLHNILEAACYGVPILFGNKNYEKFQEAVDLINRGGAFPLRDYPDLKEKYEMLNVPENFQLACAVTRQYVEENLGATEKIIHYCRNILKK